jgi:hypothetical protein
MASHILPVMCPPKRLIHFFFSIPTRNLVLTSILHDTCSVSEALVPLPDEITYGATVMRVYASAR